MISTALVARDINHSALISWVDLQKLRVIPESFPAVAAAVTTYNDIKTKTIATFPQVFSDTLDDRPMCAENMIIYLKENATPYRVSAPRPIPLRFQEPANLRTLKSISTLNPGLLHLVTNQLNGVRRPFLCLKVTGRYLLCSMRIRDLICFIY